MNQSDVGRWELRLGLFQVVILLGLIMGLLTCVFFLGYFSGRQVGHDAALSASITNTIRMPIGSSESDEEGADSTGKSVASEVYAKLNEERAAAPNSGAAPVVGEVPQLGLIDSTEASPIDAIAADPYAGGGTPAADTVPAVPTSSDEARDKLLKQVIAIDAEQGNGGQQARVPAENIPDTAIDTIAVATAVVVLPTPTAVKPTATPKPAKTEKAADIGETIPKGWFAQVAAPRKKEDAASLSKQLRKSGFAVIVEVAQVRGEQYYRILAGPEQSRAQAEKLVQQLKREPYLPTQPFIRQIK